MGPLFYVFTLNETALCLPRKAEIHIAILRFVSSYN